MSPQEPGKRSPREETLGRSAEITSMMMFCFASVQESQPVPMLIKQMETNICAAAKSIAQAQPAMR